MTTILGEFLQPRGAARALAEALGISAVTVSQWATGVKSIPPDRCPEIERSTAGRVTCDELRPDVAWVRVPDPDWPHPQGRPCIDIASPLKHAAQPMPTSETSDAT